MAPSASGATGSGAYPPLGGLIADSYALGERIAVGRTGSIHRGTVPETGQPIAIRLAHPHLSSDAKWTQRFYAEAFACMHLHHPNTIRTFDVGLASDGPLYLVSELVEGRTLADALRDGPLAPEHVLRILIQCCASLAEAHARGRMHHDLRPTKILLPFAGPPASVKLAHFSVYRAHEAAGARSQTGARGFDPAFLAPEQIRGEPVDERTDLYALGIVGYTALAGAPPFRGDQVSVMHGHLQEWPALLSPQYRGAFKMSSSTRSSRLRRSAGSRAPRRCWNAASRYSRDSEPLRKHGTLRP